MNQIVDMGNTISLLLLDFCPLKPPQTRNKEQKNQGKSEYLNRLFVVLFWQF